MKSRQRLLGALKGTPIDRVPWSPFLAYYWESLPDTERAKGQIEYMKEMGADPLLRGAYNLTQSVFHNCMIDANQMGRERIITYDTPVGTLTEKYVYSSNGNTNFLTEHPVKDTEDFKILQYIFENMEVRENLKPFEEAFRRYGDDALFLPHFAIGNKTAFQTMVEHWVGTENLAYAVYDEPEAVEACLEVMRERNQEALTSALNSSADGFWFSEDSSTTNISPAFFKKYTMPEINRWGEKIHRAGKLLVHHACGHIRHLLPLMADSVIDAIESITPPPTGNVTLQEASAILPDHIALVGGIDPVLLLNGSLAEVCSMAEKLIRDMSVSGRRFILANYDSCPPGVAYEKFLKLSELVRKVR